MPYADPHSAAARASSARRRARYVATERGRETRRAGDRRRSGSALRRASHARYVATERGRETRRAGDRRRSGSALRRASHRAASERYLVTAKGIIASERNYRRRRLNTHLAQYVQLTEQLKALEAA